MRFYLQYIFKFFNVLNYSAWHGANNFFYDVQGYIKVADYIAFEDVIPASAASLMLLVFKKECFFIA